MLRNWLRWIPHRTPTSRTPYVRRRPCVPLCEALGDRLAPAVSAVFLPSSGILAVIGDDLNNTITVSRTASGLMLVNGATVPTTHGPLTAAQTTRIFVPRCDFRTSVGFGDGPGAREKLGLRGGGPTAVITDLGVLRPDLASCEFVLTELHPGVTVDDARAATGWELRVADTVSATAAPTDAELAALRALVAT